MGATANGFSIWRKPEASLPRDAPAARRPAGLLRRWKSVAGFVGAWLVLGAVWELGARLGVLNASILPPPSQFIPYLFSTSGSVGLGVNKVSYGAALIETVLRVGAGFVLGVGAGLAAGMLLAASPLVRVIGVPIAQILAPIAPIAWIPLAIVLFGTGDGAAVFVVFMGIAATMTLATVAALAGVPSEYVKSARSLGSKGWQLWLRVILPAAAPGIATAVRLSFFAAWMSVLAGEMAGINSGLGSLVIMGQQQFQMKLVMAGLVTIGLLGFFFDRLLLLVRRRLLWWEARGARAVAGDA
jgi:ABC-type nitrate/sulfonate/bicarbonate transport system permease component